MQLPFVSLNNAQKWKIPPPARNNALIGTLHKENTITRWQFIAQEWFLDAAHQNRDTARSSSF